MKKLILHIGFHKTGTSALQEYFDENRKTLETQGIFYPKSLNGKFPGNVDLSWAFNENAPPYASLNSDEKLQIKSYYKNQMDNTECETIIVSSEDFVLLDGQFKSIENVKDFFSDYDVSIVAYVREPIDFMISLYSHAIRARLLDCTFKSYISKHYSFRAADFPLRLQPWRRCFSDEAIVVKKFAPKEFYKGTLVNDFFHAVGIDVKLDMTMNRSNVGVHPWLIQSYIETSKSSIGEPNKEKILRKIIKLGSEFPKDNAAKFLLNDEDYELILNTLKPSLNKLKREYGIEFNS
jgi:hypothetical protein